MNLKSGVFFIILPLLSVNGYELTYLMDAWPKLPETLRRAILAIVQSGE
jgi:hypothetical protein